MGKTAYVDLSNSAIETQLTDPGSLAAFIGGRGYGAKLLFDAAGPAVDPLSPQNPLIFTTGPFTGTSWSTNLPTYDTTLLGAHTIVAIPDGKVLVGADAAESYQAAYSADKGVTFGVITAESLYGNGNEHVIFDVDFKNNNFIYMADDNPETATNPGTVYRNTVPSSTRWSDNDMMSLGNGGTYIFALDSSGDLDWPAGDNPPHPVGQYGIAQAWTGDPQPALYSAHAAVTTSLAAAGSAPGVAQWEWVDAPEQ